MQVAIVDVGATMACGLIVITWVELIFPQFDEVAIRVIVNTPAVEKVTLVEEELVEEKIGPEGIELQLHDKMVPLPLVTTKASVSPAQPEGFRVKVICAYVNELMENRKANIKKIFFIN